MADSGNFAARWTPRVLSILRIIVGLLILQHGLQKWFGFPPGSKPHEGLDYLSLIGFAALLETIGGVLLVLGLFTRPAAFLLSGLMAVAYFMAHAPQGFFPILNKGELAIAYCFVCLFLAIAGGGVWSLDRLRRGSTTPYSTNS